MNARNLFTLNPDYSKRVYGLDVFRAVAILLVVISHGGFMIDQALPGFPYVKLIDGVELFFVLSGFLIGTILLKIYSEKHSLSGSQLTAFWKRRWLRTLPNYYLVLFLNLAFVSAGIINGNAQMFNWKFLFFLQNFNSYFTDFFWESWSLTVEEWFYIIIPLFIFLFQKIIKKVMGDKNFFLVTILLFIFLPLLYRIYISPEQVDVFWHDVKFRKVVMTRLDAIMYGVLFAWVKFYHPELWKKIALPFFFSGIVMLYFFMYIQAANPTGFFSKTFYFSLIGLAAAMLLPFADSVKTFRTRFGKVMTHISLISYSMYLLNLGIIADVIRKHFEPTTPFGGLLTYSIYWILVFGLSTLLYKYFEKPVMDVRNDK